MLSTHIRPCNWVEVTQTKATAGITVVVSDEKHQGCDDGQVGTYSRPELVAAAGEGVKPAKHRFS